MSDEREELHDRIDAHLERVVLLRAEETTVRDLRAREAELEADLLMAEAAVKTGRARGEPGVAAEEAGAIVALAESIRRLEGDGPAEASAATGASRHLELGVAALEDWLAAPAVKDSRRVPLIARSIVLVLVILVVWASIALHPALLLLLVPVVVPLSFLMREGENAQWRRLGAKRRFDGLGLAPPKAWSEESVRARIEDLNESASRAAAAVEAARARDDAGAGAATEIAAEELAELRDADPDSLRRELQARLAGIGVDSLDADLESWLSTVARAEHCRVELEATRSQRESLAARSGDAREAIHRFLARHQLAPPGGTADTDALAKGLQRAKRDL